MTMPPYTPRRPGGCQSGRALEKQVLSAGCNRRSRISSSSLLGDGIEGDGVMGDEADSENFSCRYVSPALPNVAPLPPWQCDCSREPGLNAVRRFISDVRSILSAGSQLHELHDLGQELKVTSHFGASENHRICFESGSSTHRIMNEIPTHYKACCYAKPGENSIELRSDVPTPTPGPGEVLINLYAYRTAFKVRSLKSCADRTHSGVCHSDYAVMTNG